MCLPVAGIKTIKKDEKTHMDCKEMILSNNIYDYITDFPINAIENYTPPFCYDDIEGQYNVLYINKSIIPNLDVAFFAYQNIPKLYGLMQEGSFDPASLIVSGITQVQRPPLNLRGSTFN